MRSEPKSVKKDWKIGFQWKTKLRNAYGPSQSQNHWRQNWNWTPRKSTRGKRAVSPTPVSVIKTKNSAKKPKTKSKEPKSVKKDEKSEVKTNKTPKSKAKPIEDKTGTETPRKSTGGKPVVSPTLEQDLTPILVENVEKSADQLKVTPIQDKTETPLKSTGGKHAVSPTPEPVIKTKNSGKKSDRTELVKLELSLELDLTPIPVEKVEKSADPLKAKPIEDKTETEILRKSMGGKRAVCATLEPVIKTKNSAKKPKTKSKEPKSVKMDEKPEVKTTKAPKRKAKPIEDKTDTKTLRKSTRGKRAVSPTPESVINTENSAKKPKTKSKEPKSVKKDENPEVKTTKAPKSKAKPTEETNRRTLRPRKWPQNK